MHGPAPMLPPAREESVRALESASIELVGQIVGSSNETFLVRLGGSAPEADVDDRAEEADEDGSGSFADLAPRNQVHAVYKPELGERPLHDFPPGLFRRERAAHVLARHLGWDLVPPTIIREDGPLGIGSLQLFEHHDPTENYFTAYLRAARAGGPGRRATPVVLEAFGDPTDLSLFAGDVDGASGRADSFDADPVDEQEPAEEGLQRAHGSAGPPASGPPGDVLSWLRRLAVFDVLANNADRKAGHVLHGHDGRLWAIDHGLSFAEELKLRTVIWDFAGDALGDETLEVLWTVIDEVPDEITELLHPVEVRALRGRARWLAAVGELPGDPTGMRLPWPLI
ncbi:hypothetical protein [Brachybacterium sp. FME24]|uniref:hypothetical protein n=1 Tax=Brachybacterium sp. FME24 TaxID=2742605 RepID=UPI0018668E4E|nr:hypothetical protein [Brachybacterium sp. FME24]